MLIVEIDMRNTQPPKAGIATLAHIFGPAIHAQPLAVLRANVTELSGQYGLIAAALQGAPDQLLVTPLAVNVGRIEEIDALVEGMLNCGNRFGFIGRTVE